jgi:hypothetical protein
MEIIIATVQITVFIRSPRARMDKKTLEKYTEKSSRTVLENNKTWYLYGKYDHDCQDQEIGNYIASVTCKRTILDQENVDIQTTEEYKKFKDD